MKRYIVRYRGESLADALYGYSLSKYPKTREAAIGDVDSALAHWQDISLYRITIEKCPKGRKPKKWSKK